MKARAFGKDVFRDVANKQQQQQAKQQKFGPTQPGGRARLSFLLFLFFYFFYLFIFIIISFFLSFFLSFFFLFLNSINSIHSIHSIQFNFEAAKDARELVKGEQACSHEVERRLEKKRAPRKERNLKESNKIQKRKANGRKACLTLAVTSQCRIFIKRPGGPWTGTGQISRGAAQASLPITAQPHAAFPSGY